LFSHKIRNFIILDSVILYEAIKRIQGDPMKNILILFAVLLFIPLFYIEAQSNQTKTEFDDDDDQIGKEIENFVDRITKQWDSREEQDWNSDEDTVSQDLKQSSEDTWSNEEKSSRTFSGDKVIEESEVITGNVVVKGGDLTVYGKVDGDVMVVGGDLHVKSTGRVTGNARIINGSIVKDEGGIIEGYEDRPVQRKPVT